MSFPFSHLWQTNHDSYYGRTKARNSVINIHNTHTSNQIALYSMYMYICVRVRVSMCECVTITDLTAQILLHWCRFWIKLSHTHTHSVKERKEKGGHHCHFEFNSRLNFLHFKLLFFQFSILTSLGFYANFGTAVHELFGRSIRALWFEY